VASVPDFLCPLGFFFADMSETAVYTLQQVAEHNTDEDCWFAIHGKVYDVTKFLEDHPGGIDSLTAVAGTDASEDFDAVAHSKPAIESMAKWEVGILEPSSVKPSKRAVQTHNTAVSSDSGMGSILLKVGVVGAIIVAYYLTRKQ